MKIVVERSNRKTIMMRVINSSELLIKAPSKINENEINSFILANKRWVEKQIIKINKLKKNEWSPNYTSGELFFVFGELYPLVLLSQKVFPIIKNKQIIVSNSVIKSPPLQVLQAYKKFARNYFDSTLIELSSLLGFNYSSWKLKNNKTNWGSCSSKKNINLNWRLIMAPPEVIRYVIIHELCHLKQMNHSNRFWALVEQFDPLWREHSNWLKINGYLLHSI